ncbi:MAG: hypothetical protein MZV64_14395 [Ignavibacteriales bacterium]|nr:hypothetical protein [Ignavibacteriales bacterium]
MALPPADLYRLQFARPDRQAHRAGPPVPEKGRAAGGHEVRPADHGRRAPARQEDRAAAHRGGARPDASGCAPS